MYGVFFDPSFSLVTSTLSVTKSCLFCLSYHSQIQPDLPHVLAYQAVRISHQNININTYLAFVALILLVLTVFYRCCHYTLFTGEEFEAYLDIWTQISAKTRHCFISTLTLGIASSSKSTGRTQRQAHAKRNLGSQTHKHAA